MIARKMIVVTFVLLSNLLQTGFAQTEPQALSEEEFKKRRELLTTAEKTLKSEFEGNDAVIEEMIRRVSPWYLKPESLSMITVIPVYGMTGTGKTAVIKRLVKLLEVSSFMENDLGQLSQESAVHKSVFRSIPMNAASGGVFLLDELQKARTLDETGRKIPTGADHVRLWSLLSDGKLNFEFETWERRDFLTILEGLTKPDPEPWRWPLLFDSERELQLYIFSEGMDPVELKRRILNKDMDLIRKIYENAKKMQGSYTVDLRKSLVFLTGNIDQAFGIDRVDAEGNGANEIHRRSLEVDSAGITTALREMFAPEQVGRLSFKPIIVRALSENSFQEIIKKELRTFANQVRKQSGITIRFHFRSVIEGIYNEVVSPALGARPVKAGISSLLGAYYPNWLRLAKAKNATGIAVKFDNDHYKFTVQGYRERVREVVFHHEDVLDYSRQRERSTPHTGDFNILVAIHEAGHAVLEIALNKRLPQIVKSKSLERGTGGFMMPQSPQTGSAYYDRNELINRIAIIYGGFVAEERVLGSTSIGVSGDFRQATELAVKIANQFGMQGSLAAVHRDPEAGETFVLDDKGTRNSEIESALQEGLELARTTIRKQARLLVGIGEFLRENTTLEKETMAQIVEKYYTGSAEVKAAIISDTYKSNCTNTIQDWILRGMHQK